MDLSRLVPPQCQRDAMHRSDLRRELASRRAPQLPGPEERRLLRLHAGLKVRDVAEVLRVSSSAASRWESGQRTPRGKNLRSYAEFLAVLEEGD